MAVNVTICRERISISFHKLSTFCCIGTDLIAGFEKRHVHHVHVFIAHGNQNRRSQKDHLDLWLSDMDFSPFLASNRRK